MASPGPTPLSDIGQACVFALMQCGDSGGNLRPNAVDGTDSPDQRWCVEAEGQGARRVAHEEICRAAESTRLVSINHDYAEVMKRKRNVAKTAKAPKLSRTQAPDHMTP